MPVKVVIAAANATYSFFFFHLFQINDKSPLLCTERSHLRWFGIWLGFHLGPLEGFRARPQGRPTLAGEIIYLIWSGITSGSPKEGVWNTLLSLLRPVPWMGGIMVDGWMDEWMDLQTARSGFTGPTLWTVTQEWAASSNCHVSSGIIGHVFFDSGPILFCVSHLLPCFRSWVQHNCCYHKSQVCFVRCNVILCAIYKQYLEHHNNVMPWKHLSWGKHAYSGILPSDEYHDNIKQAIQWQKTYDLATKLILLISRTATCIYCCLKQNVRVYLL